jgi:hypothetical protein
MQGVQIEPPLCVGGDFNPGNNRGVDIFVELAYFTH